MRAVFILPRFESVGERHRGNRHKTFGHCSCLQSIGWQSPVPYLVAVVQCEAACSKHVEPGSPQ